MTPFSTRTNTYYSATASPGHIVRHQRLYLMIFSASTHVPGVKRTLSIARTKDLNGPWTIDPEPIVPPAEQVENSSLYYERKNRTWFLFTNHIGVDEQGYEWTDAIWVYWTKDLSRWDPKDKAVVLDGKNCTWSKQCIGMPSVVQVKDRLAILCDAPGGNSRSHMQRDIGLAGADAKVILWDIEKLQPIVQLGPRHRIRTRPIFPEPGIEVVEGVFSLDPVTTVAIGGDGKRIAASQGNNVTPWDVSAARVERKLQGGEGPIFSIAFSPTSSLIATATDRLEVVVWKADTGQAEQVLDAQKGSTFFSYEPRGNISFSPDGRLLAYWDSDDAVILWDVERRLIVAELKGHTRDIKSVPFSPNGKILASGGDDQRVVLWDVTNSRRIGELRERNKAVLSS